MCIRLQGCDVTGIREIWWDGSYDWSAGMEGSSLFRKERQGDEEGLSPSLSVMTWSAWSSAWGCMRSRPTAYGSGLKGGHRQVTLQWGIAIGCTTRKTEWIRTSVTRKEQPYIHKPWASWRTSATPMSVGGQGSRA